MTSKIAWDAPYLANSISEDQLYTRRMIVSRVSKPGQIPKVNGAVIYFRYSNSVDGFEHFLIYDSITELLEVTGKKKLEDMAGKQVNVVFRDVFTTERRGNYSLMYGVSNVPIEKKVIPIPTTNIAETVAVPALEIPQPTLSN